MATFTGTDGEDNLNGGANDDSLFGLGGRDRLNGGAGNDLLDGGDGDDFAIYTDAASGVTVDLRNLSPQDTIGAGIDTLIGIENIYGSNFADTLTGDANANFILGGAGSDTLVGNGGADTLSGGTGVDTMIGGSGDDAYFVDTPADVIVEQANDGIDLMLVGETGLSFVLPDNVENMRVSTVFPGIATLTGNSLNNIIEGSHFTTDVIDGGVGADTMIGYQGDDSYYVDNAGDVVVEAAGAGFEQVFASVSYALTDNVENLTLTGTQAIDGTGNALNNVITGNANNNVISGGAGGDILSGGAGNDTLIGGSGDDQLSGGAGDDLLIEGAYAGPRTNDIYDGGDGVDTVDLHNAPAGVTVDLRIAGAQNTGGDGVDTFIGVENIIGTAFDDVLIGVANVRNTLSGGAGNDLFDGGAGQDVIDGGTGIDTVTYEGAAGGVSINLEMGGGNGDGLTSIENVIGSAFADVLNGSTVANVLTGGAGDDYLNGFDGNDTLIGGAGADTLLGGNGDDTYVVDGFDTISEANGGGVDLVLSSANFVLTADLENLTLTGAAAINGTGSGSSNQIIGNAGANILSGGAGQDTLVGAAGNDRLSGGADNDVLTGGTGADVFVDTAAGLNGDTIRDMTAEDRIVISDGSLAGFTYSLTGNRLSYTGGFLDLDVIPTGRLVAGAAAGGGVELRWAPRAVANDFNGDGRSDILWRNADGSLGNWLGDANGNFAVNGAVPLKNVPNEWHITATGDFNGDGRSDILWRNDSGALGDWLGTATGDFTTNPQLVNVPTEWKVAGTGDFNGDGRSDILWRNDNGLVGDWLGTASGNFSINSGSLVAVPTAWKIAGVGDFNGDGRSDILWRNDDGTIGNWLGNASGNFDINNASVAGVPNEWKIVGVGDFNGDGRSDILWRNAGGAVGDWLGTASGGFTVNPTLTQVPNEWKVAATGDYNGDGRDDILWRSDSGALGDWLGTASGNFTINGGLYQVPTSWHVQPEMLV